MTTNPSISTSHPTTNCFPSIDRRFWGAEYPFDLDEEKGKQKLQDALDIGITHFIVLTEEELAKHPEFVDMLAMNKTVMERWNKIVAPGDKVFVKGNIPESEWCKFINGVIL